MIIPYIYLDNSTTSKISDTVFKKMTPFFKEHWGSPLSPHFKGQELQNSIHDSYKILYNFLGAHEHDHFILTSSGTEAVNHVISAIYRDITMTTGKNQFLTSATDEAPAIMAITQLEKMGCSHRTVPVNQAGLITVDALAQTISPRTCLISLSWANGLTGVIQPVVDIAEFCQQRGIRLHLDATHVLGKLPIDMKEIPVDYLTFNGSQLHGPTNTGGLYIRQGVKCSPYIFGGADQGNMRAGQLNMPGLVGLACAATEAQENLDLLGTETARLRNKLENELSKILPLTVCYKTQTRLPHCTTLLFPGMTNESLLFLLNRQKVCASIGGGNFQQLALLLLTAGFDENLAHSALSFSLSRYTTEEEIDSAIQIIGECAKNLAKHSDKILHPNPLGLL